MKKFFVSLFLLCSISKMASAQQDIHFSQFYSPAILLNPATTGVSNGNFRAIANYRSQWSSISEPFTTISAAADGRFFQDSWKTSFLGAGMFFYNDKTGASKFTTGHYGITLSYTLEVSKDMYLSFGISPGFMQRSISYSGLYFGNQFNGISYDQTVNSGESTGGQSVSAFDIGAGTYFIYRSDDRTAFYAGVSGQHLTAPNLSFNASDDKLLRKITLHGGAEIGLPNTNVTILPNTLVMLQGPNRIINIGSDFKYVIQEQSHFTGFVNELSFGLGGYYRVGDAFWATAQFNWTGLTLGFSYDFNLSDLSVATNGNGGMEVMLMYRAGIGHGKGKSTRFL